jgi:hypothetical protein
MSTSVTELPIKTANPTARGRLSPSSARLILVLVACAAIAASAAATGSAASSRAVAEAGPDLTRLLRAMAGIKMLLAGLAAVAVYWRLGAATGALRLAGYAAACGAMAAGPALIWDMAHVGAGALLLHGGLLATILLLWRDPGTAAVLERAIATRRAALRGR